MKKVLVYGWYNKGNLGDDLFIDAFNKLFPNINFTFTDQITKELLQDKDAVFFGGGSFLYAKPQIDDNCWNLLLSIPIFYIGVGFENIHPEHYKLIKKAKLIAARSLIGIDEIQLLNDNIILIPDIVYSLKEDFKANKIDNSVLIIPNLSVVPQNHDPHWMHSSWNYFKSEFSQFLDCLVEKEYKVQIYSMCNNHNESDLWPAYEIISSMKHRKSDYCIDICHNFKDIINIISNSSIVITQRFHGIILSEIARRPYISLYHHDKLKKQSYNYGKFVSYYGLNKQNLLDNFFHEINKDYCNIMSIEPDTFKDLQTSVSSLL